MASNTNQAIGSLDLSLYNNSWYQCGRRKWTQALWFFLGGPLVRCPLLPGSGFRKWLLQLFGATIGTGVVIKPGVRVKYPWRLRIGDHSWIGEDCWIDNVDQVTIGSHACLSQGVYLCTGGHSISDPAFGLYTRPIRIEDRAWIAAHVKVAPGTVVETGAVATMGSVVSGCVESCTIAAGNPARSVGSRYVNETASSLEARGDGAEGCVEHVPNGRVETAVSRGTDLREVDRKEILDRIWAQIKRVAPARASIRHDDQWASAYGLDSLTMLVFRENCESEFQVTIADQEWVALSSCAQLADLISAKLRNGSLAKMRTVHNAIPTAAATQKAASLSPLNDSLSEQLEVGMPLTGINGLAETPLLKYLGDLRWRHIARMSGVPSRRMSDDENNRLYATFFYVELSFPEAKPMSSYGENDTFTVISTLKRYGTSILDGTAFLLGEDHSEAAAEPFQTMEAANGAGVPAIRLSNIFVTQFSGAEWLRKSRPRSGLIDNIQELEQAPETHVLLKKAASGAIEEPDPSWRPVDGRVHEYRYHMQPDRDVNGAGLLYFANYPTFLDLAERQALDSVEGDYTADVVNTRALVHRKLAYLNNASWRQTLRIKTRLFSRATAGGRLIRSEQLMYRESDDRLMCVSSSEKIVKVPTTESKHIDRPR